jgi:ribosomal protein S18 acetylase RimI-like enzyme
VAAPEPVIHLDPAQQDQAVGLICESFKNDPAGVYAAPDTAKRAPLLSWFARTGLKVGFSCGEIFTTPSLTGVAIWFRPGSEHLSLWALLRQKTFPPLQAGPASLWRFFQAVDCVSRVHRQHVPGPHWYLFLLTVAPACHGQGLGGRLIQPILDRADAAGLPCYLETTNPPAVPFYEKHGFKVVHQDQLPNGRTPFWGLRRDPP